MGNWKAFVKNVRKGNQDVELYDLSVDPREQNNVAAAHPEIIKRVLEISVQNIQRLKLKIQFASVVKLSC